MRLRLRVRTTNTDFGIVYMKIIEAIRHSLQGRKEEGQWINAALWRNLTGRN